MPLEYNMGIARGAPAAMPVPQSPRRVPALAQVAVPEDGTFQPFSWRSFFAAAGSYG